MNLWQRWMPPLQSLHTLLMIIMTLGYLLATHLSTINSLKAAISGKADRFELEQLDKKLTRIEVKLEEAVMTKAELDRLRDHLDRTIMGAAVRLSGDKGEENPNGN